MTLRPAAACSPDPEHAHRRSGLAEIRTCLFCRGTGSCARCDGLGQWLVRRGWLRLKHRVPCNACSGSTHCALCHGHGALRGK